MSYADTVPAGLVWPPHRAPLPISVAIHLVTLTLFRPQGRRSRIDGPWMIEVADCPHHQLQLHLRRAPGRSAYATAKSAVDVFMDSFVRRSDKRHASALAAALEEADSTVEDTVAAWEGYRRCSTASGWSMRRAGCG
jgi:hypothetical protein